MDLARTGRLHVVLRLVQRCYSEHVKGEERGEKDLYPEAISRLVHGF